MRLTLVAKNILSYVRLTLVARNNVSCNRSISSLNRFPRFPLSLPHAPTSYVQMRACVCVSISHFVFTCIHTGLHTYAYIYITNMLKEDTHTHANTRTHTHSLSFSLSLSHTHTYTCMQIHVSRTYRESTLANFIELAIEIAWFGVFANW